MPHRPPVLERRTLLGGVAAAGAAAAAVAVLPVRPEPDATVAQAQPAPAADAGGYQLTEHVKQYYASARI